MHDLRLLGGPGGRPESERSEDEGADFRSRLSYDVVEQIIKKKNLV